MWAAAAVVPLLAAGLWAMPEASAQSRAGSGQASLTSAQAAALSKNVTRKVIVVLKDQVPQASSSRAQVHARSAIEQRERQPILGELSLTNAQHVHAYTTINAVAATVSPGEAARLAANPAVARVVPDQIIHIGTPLDAASNGGPSTGRTPIPGICPAPGDPM